MQTAGFDLDPVHTAGLGLYPMHTPGLGLGPMHTADLGLGLGKQDTIQLRRENFSLTWVHTPTSSRESPVW